uniref:Calcineurin B homologous protein 3 n=1 Tax=Scophthalmus maximus TaxID=52904 RepID=A0A8D3CTN8_SCOMX
MGALQSLHGRPEYLDLAEKTGFSFEQIRVLHERFKQLSHNEETLRRSHFNEIPDLACNPIRAQIIEAFFDRRNYHQNGEGTVEEIGFEEFLVVMSHFRPPSLHMTEEQRENVRREKLRFVFNMHDTDNDGTITLEEYRHHHHRFHLNFESDWKRIQVVVLFGHCRGKTPERTLVLFLRAPEEVVSTTVKITEGKRDVCTLKLPHHFL